MCILQVCVGVQVLIVSANFKKISFERNIICNVVCWYSSHFFVVSKNVMPVSIHALKSVFECKQTSETREFLPPSFGSLWRIHLRYRSLELHFWRHMLVSLTIYAVFMFWNKRVHICNLLKSFWRLPRSPTFALPMDSIVFRLYFDGKSMREREASCKQLYSSLLSCLKFQTRCNGRIQLISSRGICHD